MAVYLVDRCGHLRCYLSDGGCWSCSGRLTERCACHLLCCCAVIVLSCDEGSVPCWALTAEVCAGSSVWYLLLSSSFPWRLLGSRGEITLQTATAKLTTAHLTELGIILQWSYLNEINPLVVRVILFVGLLEVIFYSETTNIKPSSYIFNLPSYIMTKLGIFYWVLKFQSNYALWQVKTC